MKPFEPNDPQPPPSTEPTESLQPLSDLARIEQLTALLSNYEAANDELREEVSLARRELAGVNPLLLSFGAGVQRYVCNARSIRGMSLKQRSETRGSGVQETILLSALWTLMIDEVSVTAYLGEAEAVAALAEAEARWSEAISEPTNPPPPNPPEETP